MQQCSENLNAGIDEAFYYYRYVIIVSQKMALRSFAC